MTIPLESSKQTSENLEIKLTPDYLIKKLESAALSTVDQKEKDGHKKVIARIKELQSGTNGVAENWWKKLRDQLSDADKNLASKVSGSEDITKKLGIETALVALKQGADASVKSASEKVEQAKKAIEKGDMGATAVAAGAIVTEKTGGIMKKFSEAKGLEKLDVIREAGATVMEKVGQFFALLFSFLSFDSSKIKDAWNTLIGVPKDVADAMGKGKKIVESGTGNKVLKPIEEAYAKVREAQKSKNPQLIAVAVKEYREAKEKIKDIPLPENQKKWMADVEGTIGGIEKTIKEDILKPAQEKMNIALENVKKQMIIDLRAAGIEIQDGGEKMKKFTTIWDNYAKKQADRAKELRVAVMGDGSTNGLELLTGSAMGNVEFFLDLIKENIIPASAVIAKIKETGEKTIVFGLRSVSAAATLSFGELSTIMGEVPFSKFNNLPEDKKVVLNHILMHRLTWATTLAGLTAKLAMEAIVVPVTWNERLGLDGLKAGLNTALGKYDSVAKNMQEILNQMGPAGRDLLENTPYAQMRAMLQETITKQYITQAYLNAGGNTMKFTNALKELRTLPGIHIESISTVTKAVDTSKSLIDSAKNIAGAIERPIASAGVNSLTAGKSIWANVKNLFKGPVLESTYAVGQFHEKTGGVLKSLGESVKNGKSMFGFLDRIRSAGGMMKYFKSAGSTILTIDAKNANRVADEISRITMESPNLAKAIFTHMPIAIVGISAATAKDGHKMESLWNGFKSLIPFVGPIMLLNDGSEITSGIMPKIAMMGAGCAMFTMDGWMFVRAMQSGGASGVVRFMARPVTMAVEGVVGTVGVVRTGGVLARDVYSAVKAGKAVEIAKFARIRGARGFAMVAAIIAGYIGYEYYGKRQEESFLATLKEKGILDTDGNINTEKTKEEFWKLSSKEQKKLRDTIIGSVIVSSDESGEKKFEVLEDASIKEPKILFKSAVGTKLQTEVSEVLAFIGITPKFAHSGSGIEDWMKQLNVAGITDSKMIRQVAEKANFDIPSKG